MTPAVDGVWLPGTPGTPTPFLAIRVTNPEYAPANDPIFDTIGDEA